MKRLFIDIGGPVIDDTIWKRYLDRLLISAMYAAGIEVTETEFASARRRAKENKANRPTVAALREFIDDEAEAVRLFGEAYGRLKADYGNDDGIPDFLSPNARNGLARLSGMYRLATLSNNISKVKYLLDIVGVSGFFDKHFISEEVGASKPDDAIFRFALRDTGIAPYQGMMVGDRLDNDIIPARRLGMKTALISAETGMNIDDSADIVCSNLLDLANILDTDR